MLKLIGALPFRDLGKYTDSQDRVMKYHWGKSTGRPPLPTPALGNSGSFDSWDLLDRQPDGNLSYNC